MTMSTPASAVSALAETAGALAAARQLTSGQTRGFGPGYVHEVRNTSTAPAVSVHVYSPPLTVMNHYELTDSGLVRLAVEGTERW